LLALATVILQKSSSILCGVGQNEHPLSVVQQSVLATAKQSPSCIHPHAGKVCNDSVESSNSKHWRVFNECEAGSYFANDSPHFSPKAGTLAAQSSALSGAANVLTREPSAHNVNESAPRLAVEGSHVIPDGKLGQNAIALSLQEDFAAVRFNLDSTDAGMSEKDAAEDTAPCSCK